MTSAAEEPKTSQGIPEAEFIEDVDAYMKKKSSETPEEVVNSLNELYSKYKFMETSLNTKKTRLQRQIPDIEQTLEMLKHLKAKKEAKEDMDTDFLLTEQVYCKAKVPPTEKVCLWLGANVMLEYPLDEAEALLSKNLAAAKRNVDQLNVDLDFLRDQVTTTEVSMARVHNWKVKRGGGGQAKEVMILKRQKKNPTGSHCYILCLIIINSRCALTPGFVFSPLFWIPPNPEVLFKTVTFPKIYPCFSNCMYQNEVKTEVLDLFKGFLGMVKKKPDLLIFYYTSSIIASDELLIFFAHNVRGSYSVSKNLKASLYK